MKKKIELIKNNDTDEIRENVILGFDERQSYIDNSLLERVPYMYSNIPIKTTLGKALLVCQDGYEKYFNYSYMTYRKLQTCFKSYSEYESWMKRHHLEIEGNSLKNRISFNHIKNACKRQRQRNCQKNTSGR